MTTILNLTTTQQSDTEVNQPNSISVHNQPSPAQVQPRKAKLFGQWTLVDGKLVCKWVTA
jgi:hypothetical protein